MPQGGVSGEPWSSAAPAVLRYDPAFEDTLGRAVSRFEARLTERSPFLAELLLRWTTGLAAGGTPEQYFTHPAAFPTVVLPWWVEESIAGQPEVQLQEDLIYASVCGYYGIRLIDDVMDEGDPVATGLLPVAALLQQEFQSTYARYFAPGHPFWAYFDRTWAASAEATVRDVRLRANEPETFAEVCAKKVSAATIPMVAVCFRHGLTALPLPWAPAFELMSRWHQFHNDFFDCRRDLDTGTQTLFLSEWQRRREPDEPLMSWVAREGFGWGVERLLAWSRELAPLAGATGSEPLQEYVRRRQALLAQTARDLAPGLDVVRRLRAVPA